MTWDQFKVDLQSALVAWYNIVLSGASRNRQYDAKQDIVARVNEWAGRNDTRHDLCDAYIRDFIYEKFGN